MAEPPGDTLDSRSMTSTPPWPWFARADQTEMEQEIFEPGATIYLDRFKPPKWWKSTFGSLTETQRAIHVVQSCKIFYASSLRPRKLTQDEINVLTDIGADSANRLVPIFPVSVALTYFFVRNAKPWSIFPRSMPLFTGLRAILGRPGVRACATWPYMYVGSWLVFRVSAYVAFEAEARKHPALEEFRQQTGELSQQVQSHVVKREVLAGKSQNRPLPGQEYPGQSTNTSTAPDRRADIPPGGLGQQGSTTQAKASGSPQKPESAWGVGEEEEDDDDDASPVSAASRPAEQAARQPTGSWDAIRQQIKAKEDARRQAKAPGDPWTRGDRSDQDTAWGRRQQDTAPEERDGQQRGVTAKEQYAYSKKDEEHELAKGQAQKEFDQMLEAERKGGEQENKRWK